MKHILLTLGIFMSVLGFSQTTTLDCYNCEAIPQAYCAPCASGLKGKEYTSGIVVDRGASNKVFIKKPFSWFVSGSVFTLTDYTGKSVSFKSTETTYGTVPAVISELTDCNCPSSGGGGGGVGSFTLNGDTGTGSVSSTLSITTGNVLKSTITGSTAVVDWDVSGVTAHSLPYYNGSNTNWRTFATGIVDDPTIGGVDATALQTVVNNLNTAIGGGGGGSYTSSNGITLASGNFKLGGTLNGTTLISMANNPISISNGTYLYNTTSSTSSILGVGTGLGAAGNGVIMGNNAASTAEASYGYVTAVTGVGFSHTDADNGDGTFAEFFLHDGTSEIETYGQSSSSAHLHLVAPTSTTVGGSELTATAPTGEINYIKVAPTFFELLNLTQYTSHATAWSARSDYQLYSLNNDATVYRKRTPGAFGDYTATPTAIFEYNVTPTGANAGSNLRVVANIAGVTAAYVSNILTITIPTGGKVLSADWRMVSADVQASADAGGVTNWVQVVFAGTGGNTGLTDLRVPAMQKTAIPASGVLSTTNAATVDLDNNPALSVVAVGSGNISLRVGGLAIGAQGYHLKFTNI